MSALLGIYTDIKDNNSYSKKYVVQKKAIGSDTEGQITMLHIIKAEDR